MKKLAHSENMMGIDFFGTHYDIGNKFGILKANVELGLKHNEVGKAFREYLNNLTF
jgi:UTP--glucose-1-phosphate uridylyltransferase